MVDFFRGIKAGLIAGLSYGIISEIFFLTRYTYYSPLSFFFVLISVIFTMFWGLILGCVFGLIFAALYDKIPGTNSIIKGITLSTLFWLIFSVLIVGFIFYSNNNSTNDTIFSLLAYIIFGFFVGFIWDKSKATENFDSEKVEYKYCQNCGRQIPSHSKFCLYCGHKSEDDIIK